MKPRVFVVMPFGQKEARPATPASVTTPATAAITIDFDSVYSQLIEPALSCAGCVPFRADKEPGAGDIRTDMFYELVTADVVLADISLLNANVFYELGVRHGVAPRGVFMIHGGWTRRPFDVAPDRTFDYDGKLFLPDQMQPRDLWTTKLDAEAKRLGQLLRGALEADPATIGSPVYKELVGLKPVDWTNIQTARAKYFGEVFADWRARVDLAKLNGWPGDILTLADEAPTRFHRGKLLWHAADALCSMHRFEAALPVLKDLIALDSEHREAQIRMGLVLDRLGKTNEARVYMLQVVEKYQNDTEAHGILGRVYKDLWRLEWKDVETLPERQLQAVATSRYLACAVGSYDQAARRKFDYYDGINVVSFVTAAGTSQGGDGRPAGRLQGRRRCRLDDCGALCRRKRAQERRPRWRAGRRLGGRDDRRVGVGRRQSRQSAHPVPRRGQYPGRDLFQRQFDARSDLSVRAARLPARRGRRREESARTAADHAREKDRRPEKVRAAVRAGRPGERTHDRQARATRGALSGTQGNRGPRSYGPATGRVEDRREEISRFAVRRRGRTSSLASCAPSAAPKCG